MIQKKYYSLRNGTNPNSTRISLNLLLKLFQDLYLIFDTKSYFQESFGFTCTDEGEIEGSLGKNIGAQIFIRLRKNNLWPINEKCLEYSKEDLFDIVEFLYDFISKPTKGTYHSFGGCGWHYSQFDKKAGQEEYKEQINLLLSDYESGFELSENGEILNLPDKGFENLIIKELPFKDPENIENKVNNAVNKFRKYKSSLSERKEAIRELADVLEFLRKDLTTILDKNDEKTIFQIANQFGIRHHNLNQLTEYDKSIWYSWMFYFYLATIHASIRLLKKQKNNPV